MKILVVNSKGYKWENKNGIFVRGYFQYDNDSDHHVYRGESAIKELSNLKNYDDFLHFLQIIDGCYSIIITSGDETWAAVDISRSLPLYFSTDGSIVSDSAEAIRQFLKIPQEDVNRYLYTKLLTSDYLFGRETVYSEINQLDLGECVCFTASRFEIRKYFKHISNVRKDISYEDAKKELNDVAFESFYALKKAIGNRPVLLSLSGGYDSRYVACLLKEIGVEDVSCYTYGKADSFEVAQSRKNAEALGFRWKCVEMTDEWVREQLDDVGVDYLNSYCGHDFTAYMQNFPAIRKLHEEGWIKPNSVILTGLCGDMPTGTYIEPFRYSKKYDIYTAAEKLYSLIVSRYKMPSFFKEKWLSDVREQIRMVSGDINDYQSWVSAIDCIYTGTCHSHWFMHMNFAHSFFGYEWLLPFWNKKVLKFWYSIPAEMRIGRKLYANWLLHDICRKYGLDQEKYVAKYNRNKTIVNLMYKIGGGISFMVLNMGIPFKRKYDYNNFAPYELQLFRNLLTRSTVSYRKAGLFHLLNQYCLQHRYGVAVMKEILRKIKE